MTNEQLLTRTAMKITADMIIEWGPCIPDYPPERVRALMPRPCTPLEILDIDIPAEDRLWVVLHEDVVPPRELRLLACDFAEAVLPLYERAYPADSYVRECISAARKYAIGKGTSAELDAARATARAAEWDASRDASSAAAWAAAWAASSAAQIDQTRAVLAALQTLESED